MPKMFQPQYSRIYVISLECNVTKIFSTDNCLGTLLIIWESTECVEKYQCIDKYYSFVWKIQIDEEQIECLGRLLVSFRKY